MGDPSLDPEYFASYEGYLRYLSGVVPYVVALPRDQERVLVVRVLVVAPICSGLGLEYGVESPFLVESLSGTDGREGAPRLYLYELVFLRCVGVRELFPYMSFLDM